MVIRSAGHCSATPGHCSATPGHCSAPRGIAATPWALQRPGGHCSGPRVGTIPYGGGGVNPGPWIIYKVRHEEAVFRAPGARGSLYLMEKRKIPKNT